MYADAAATLRATAASGSRSSTIDLGAIVAQLAAPSQRASRPAGCAAVVKADAYGLGAAPVGPALAAVGLRRLLRRALSTKGSRCAALLARAPRSPS